MTALFLSKLISKKSNLIPNYLCFCSLMLQAFNICLEESVGCLPLLFELSKQKWQALAPFFSKLEDIFGNHPLAG